MWHIYNQAEKVGKWNYIFSSAFRTAIRLQVLYSAETVATAFHIAGYLSSKKGGTL
jgi:hypothetical protein